MLFRIRASNLHFDDVRPDPIRDTDPSIPGNLKRIQGHFALMLVRFTVAAGLAVTIAFLSRHTVEAEFLALKDRWTAGTFDSTTESRAIHRGGLVRH